MMYIYSESNKQKSETTKLIGNFLQKTKRINNGVVPMCQCADVHKQKSNGYWGDCGYGSKEWYIEFALIKYII